MTRAGARHAVQWYPHLALARQRAVEFEGDVLLDLGGLGSRGLGAVVRQALASQAADPAGGLRFGWIDRLLGWFSDAAFAQGGGQGLGAAALAPPSASLSEGPRAWHTDLARGGGVFHIDLADVVPNPGIEITAPVEAYTAGNPSSSCPAAPSGATIAGWVGDEVAWLPVPGTVITDPPPGALSFLATGHLVDAAGLAGNAAGAPAGLRATGTITLYTVGHDRTPPVITPTLTTGAVLTELPAVLAHVTDRQAGVRSRTGVAATLGGVSIAVVYDAATGEVQVPAAARRLPPGLNGPTVLMLDVTDGFCNIATANVSVVARAGTAGPATPTATPGSRTPTPTTTPGSRTPTPTATRGTVEPTPTGTRRTPTATRTPGTGRFRLYLPSAQQRRS